MMHLFSNKTKAPEIGCFFDFNDIGSDGQYRQTPFIPPGFYADHDKADADGADCTDQKHGLGAAIAEPAAQGGGNGAGDEVTDIYKGFLQGHG